MAYKCNWAFVDCGLDLMMVMMMKRVGMKMNVTVMIKVREKKIKQVNSMYFGFCHLGSVNLESES